MADGGVPNLINELRNQAQQSTIERLEHLVGTDEQLTDMLIEHLATVLPSPEHLTICELILIDSAEKIIPVIRRIFTLFPEAIPDFISTLLASSFYAQRQAVPKLIVNLGYMDAKEALRRCLKDPVVSVIRSVACVLEEYEQIPFTDDELVEITMELNKHYSEYIQCTVPDIVVLIKQPTLFVQEICKSSSWRKRHAIAKKVSKLSFQDRVTVYSHLSQDPEEEIRICLAKNMDCIGDWSKLAPQFLKDSSPAVRALAVQIIGNRDEFQDMLKEVVSDASWEVRKELLCVQKSETYKSVAIPLINSLNTTPNWRVRKEVLASIALISRHNENLLKDSLSKHLLKYLHDSIYEIRIETSKIVEELISMYSWTIEWLPEIESAVESKSYLHRMTAANAALAFDKAHKTVFTKKLLNDTIDNVKLYTLDIINMDNVNEDVRGMILALRDSEDEEIRKTVARLLDAD